ncbi:MAG: thiamine pyrophosphate-dependent enzyme [Acidobacteriaceae bacterium]|jgi:TPP-dependent pyruvate/acetoin dehydrogenase alpha subunit
MMAESADAGAAWENPLIPNAKLRQIYRAMVRLRTLARALPAGGRDGLSLEACLVSTSVDLGPGDLVSDAVAGGVVEFLRGAGLGAVLRPGKAKSKRGPVADCGSAARLPGGMGIAERIWAALGAAAALKAAAAQAGVENKAAGESPKDTRVVVVYVPAGEVPVAVWRKALTFAVKHELPAVFVVLPARGGKGRAGGLVALALRCRVPGIPVDADDAVAIYRVAQESVGRARIGGGAALMECVPFAVEGTAAKRTAADGLAGLERYLLQRGIATKMWMEREAKGFAKRVAREKTSK